MNLYDAMIIVPDQLSEEQVTAVQQRVQDEIARAGGTVKLSRVLGRRSFARTMKKQESGRYARIRFELGPAAMQAFNERLKLVDNLFRVQITKVTAAQEAMEAARAARGEEEGSARRNDVDALSDAMVD